LTIVALLLASCSTPKETPADAAAQPLVPADSGVAEAKKGRAAPPIKEATRQEAEKALADLEGWVKEGATDPQNPWALAHGIVGFGPELKVPDGRLAIDVIVGDFLKKGPQGYAFPATSETTGFPVEPHKDLLLKTLIESGVPQTRSFKLKGGGKVKLREIFEDAEKRFAFPTDDSGWRNYAWTAYAMLLGNKSLEKVDTPARSYPFREVAARTVDRLEQEQSIFDVWAGHPELVEKRKQGIYAHHCGGLHFVQAAVVAASVVKDPLLIERVKRQLDLVLFRWDAERRIYKEALWNEPKYRWVLLVQELKFYGHVLETFALAKDYGLFEADAVSSAKMRQVAGDLVETVGWLAEAYKKETMQQLPAQTRFDLTGDGCHAIRGLRRGLVAFFAP
jgi:hypothetical protein